MAGRLTTYCYFFPLSLDNINGNINGETTLWHSNGIFSSGPNLPIAVSYSCLVQYDDNTTYLTGGLQIVGNITQNIVYKYDWITNTWTQKSGMLEHRCGKHKVWGQSYKDFYTLGQI